MVETDNTLCQGINPIVPSDPGLRIYPKDAAAPSRADDPCTIGQTGQRHACIFPVPHGAEFLHVACCTALHGTVFSLLRFTFDLWQRTERYTWL